jgi:hypothetical protein
VKDSGSSSV